ncbi:MAG: hypothetical protein SW833_04025 [Cyanobacteriota bacterium]|nr:hypothetical protein [Cyanobacteriota bacterium]
MLQSKPDEKIIYYTILILWGLGSFGWFSDLEVNFVEKVGGLSIFLQAGFILLYIGHRKERWKKRKRSSSQS